MRNLHHTIIYKENCRSDCPFLKSRDSVVIPPPAKTVGIIISRDPPITWSSFYRHCSNQPDPRIRRALLYAWGIPNQLCQRVLDFREARTDSKGWEELYALVFNETYWTHLHKCFTTKTENPFEVKGYKQFICPDSLLRDEIMAAATDDTRFLLAFGRDVQKWVKREFSLRTADETQIILVGDEGQSLKIEYIKLYHPSSRNDYIWLKRTKDQRQIDETEIGLARLLHYAGIN